MTLPYNSPNCHFDLLKSNTAVTMKGSIKDKSQFILYAKILTDIYSMTVHVQCSHFKISLFQILFSFQTERVVTQEDAQWPGSDLGKEDGNTHPHSSESISLPASLLRLRGGHNPVWSHQENLLSFTGKYKKSVISHW